MKKLKLLLSLIISIFIFVGCIDVYAGSGSISVSPSSVHVGENITITVNTYSAAAWNIHVDTVGPVSNCSKIWVGDTGDESNANRDFTFTCATTGEGSVTVSLSGDISEVDSNHNITKSYLSGSRTVTVTAAQNNNNNTGGGDNPVPTEVVPKPNGNNNNNNNNTNTNTNNKDEKKEEKKEEKKSSNNKIKELSIDDYELKKISDTKYELTVDNDVDMITIKAEAEDSKAKVKGIGMHELVVGENKIEITVTAEDGSKNVITIMVTREESDEEEEEKVIAPIIENDVTPPTSKFNVIPIIMIGLDVILGIAVISVFFRNKKLKESINQMA